MALQVNIFEAGSVPTAQEFVTLINELNTSLDESVTLTGEQSITGVKTFLGSKLIKFKQSVSADKLGFTLYDYQSKEVGNFEYDNKSNFRLLALGNYVSEANKEVECNIGFKIYNKLHGAAYRLLCPLAGNAKNSIASLTDTYTNFYIPLVFTNGAVSVTADTGGKVDLSTLIGSGSGDVSGLATVATTGDYNDLLNLPTLFSGDYNDLTNKPALFSGDYADLTNKPTIPTNLSDLSDDSTHRLVTDTEKTTWNNKSDFSGSYNDLTNKPTIPTVPTISTNITSDAASDTKTASPKAVKDFVEGKGYLTQHQDISGKADQTDLEALEDRVGALEQGGSGGDTTQYSYLKLIPDLDAYTEAPVGEIVMYIGQTNDKYKRGGTYEKTVTSSGTSAIKITSDTIFSGLSQYRPSFPYSYEGKGIGAFTNRGFLNHPTRIFKPIADIAVGDSVMTWEAPGEFSIYDVTTVDTNYIYFGGTQVLKSAFSSQSFDIFKNETGGVCYSPSDSQNLINSQQVSNYAERVYFPENLGPKSTVVVIGIATEIGEEGLDIKQESEESISWEPILMPTEIDSELSQVSENALQNKVLYDELRVTESGNGGTIEVVSYLNGGEPAELQVVDIDLNDCPTKRIDPEEPRNSEVFYVIEGFVNGYAYNLKNADGKAIAFTGQTPTLFKFNDIIEEGVDTVGKSGSSRNFGDIDFRSREAYVGKFFVPSYTSRSGYDKTYYAVTGTTEIETTTRTIPIPTTTVKSLKAKIAELEAQIAQISTQLQS